jgi:hypothetical protein
MMHQQNFFEMLSKNEFMGSDRFSFKYCYIQKADGDLESQAKRRSFLFCSFTFTTAAVSFSCIINLHPLLQRTD